MPEKLVGAYRVKDTYTKNIKTEIHRIEVELLNYFNLFFNGQSHLIKFE